MPPSSRKLATGEAPVVTAAATTPENAEPEGVLMRFVQHLMTPGSSLSGTMWVAFNIIMFVLFLIWLMFLVAFPDVWHVYVFGFLGGGLMCSTNFLLYQVIFNMPKEDTPSAAGDEEAKEDKETLAVEEAAPAAKTTEKKVEKAAEKKAEKKAEEIKKVAEKIVKVDNISEKVVEKAVEKAAAVEKKTEVAEKKAEVAAAVEEVVAEVVETRTEVANTKGKGVKKGVPVGKEAKVEVAPIKEVEAATPEPEATEPEAAAEDNGDDESAPTKRASKRPVARRNGKSAPRDN